MDALLLADPFMNISERIDQPERFTFLNDGILEEVERSTDEVCCSLDLALHYACLTDII